MAGAGVQTILSYGMGVESTAVLVRWILEPETRPCPLSELLVVTAQTGDEYRDTGRDVEEHVLPLMRAHGIRFVQLARAGASQTEGVAVLADTRAPEKVYLEGVFKLSDELRNNGTVPQYAGEHLCSQKYKAWVIESWLKENVYCGGARHAFGYNAEEMDRVEKCLIAFGFNSEEADRVERAAEYDSDARQAWFPLVEWGWTRADCIAYLKAALGVTWKKSCCVFCPFSCNAQNAEELVARHKDHPEQTADAMLLEHTALSLNPRGTLYRDASLIQITAAAGNSAAVEKYEAALAELPWSVYRVRRIYGDVVHRAVEIVAGGGRAETTALVAGIEGEYQERRGIGYAYREARDEQAFPGREEFFVAAPGVVAEKARYGVAWFNQEWDRAKELQMLSRTASNLAPSLRAKISQAQKSGGWKGRVWGRRAEVRPAEDGAGFIWRVILKGKRTWIEGQASGVWSALDEIGAAEPAKQGETMKVKTKKQNAKKAAKSGAVKMSDKLAQMRANPKKARKAPVPAAKAKAARPPAYKAKKRRAVKMPAVAAGEAGSAFGLPDVEVAQAPAKTAAKAGSRPLFFGVRTTGALLWMGSKGFSIEDSKAALEKFGGSATDSTLRTFVTAGKRGGLKGHTTAEITGEGAATLLAFLDERRASAAA